MRSTRLLLLAPLLLISTQTLSAQTADHPVTADSTTSLSQGANVRILVASLGSQWIPGTVALADQNCTIAMIESPGAPNEKLGVFIGAASAVQVEFRDADQAIKWRPVAIKTLVASESAGCGQPHQAGG